MENKILGKADLHIHSRYSYDGFSPVGKILERAKEAGLDLIAITDHETIEGAQEALSLSGQFGINVIVGEEIETIDGDVLGIFIKKAIPARISPLEAIKEIHAQRGLAIIPHPFNWLVGGLPLKVVCQIFQEADGIELFNAGWGGGIGRKKAQDLNLAKFRLAATGSSDAHIARQVGRAYTIFEGKSTQALFSAILNKTTKPAGISWTTMDKIIWLCNLPKRFFKRRPKIQ